MVSARQEKRRWGAAGADFKDPVGTGAAPGWTTEEIAALADPKWSVEPWKAVGVVTLATGAQLRVGDVMFAPTGVRGHLAPGVWMWQVHWSDAWERHAVRLVNTGVEPSEWLWSEPPGKPAGVPNDLCYFGTRYVDVSGTLGWQVSPTAAGLEAIPSRGCSEPASYYYKLDESTSWMRCHIGDARLPLPGEAGVDVARAGSMLVAFGGVDVEVLIAARAIDGLIVEVQAGYAWPAEEAAPSLARVRLARSVEPPKAEELRLKLAEALRVSSVRTPFVLSLEEQIRQLEQDGP